MISKNKLFVHNIESGSYFETLFLSAVISILLIRFYLHLTGYPEIAAGGVHVAHVVWGGFLMLIAVIMLLAFFGNSVKKLSAILGGIGFGAFIDELGKFITQDNNYFFEPTVALIYVIFVLLFLTLRNIQRARGFSKDEYLANAFDLVRDVVLNKINLGGSSQALKILDKCDPGNAAVISLKKIVEELGPVSARERSFVDRIEQVMHNFYKNVVTDGFLRVALLFFLGYLFFNVYRSWDFVGSYLEGFGDNFSYIEVGQFASAVAAAAIGIYGIIKILESRLLGFRIFRDSVLISIFLTQFFDFYSNQFGALVSLSINLVVFLLIEYAIFQEQSRPRQSRG